jgi:MFS family permease
MADRSKLLFINVGHGLDHLFMLLFPAVALTLEGTFGRSYGELLSLAVPGFIAFAAGTLPAGWLGDRWSRPAMLTVFFVGIGVASCLTGLARSPFELAAGLTLIGLFASIYHPVGIAMLVEGRDRVGKLLGINGVAGNVGVAAAAIVAIALSETWSWRAAFIVPGVLSIATGIAFVVLCRRWRNIESSAGPRAKLGEGGLSRTMLRLILVIGVATLLTGMTFQVTTIALPKLFDDGLQGLTENRYGIGGLVSLVIMAAAFAQVAVGWLIDRYPVKPVWIIVLFAQAPLIALAGVLAGYGLVVLSFAMMVVIIGEIPIQDALVTRYTAERYRSRVFGIKFLLGLGASAVAAPLVAGMHSISGGFLWLFIGLGGAAAMVGVIAFWLPSTVETAPRIVRSPA